MLGLLPLSDVGRFMPAVPGHGCTIPGSLIPFCSSPIMLLYGFHAVMARLRQAPASFKSLYVDRHRDDNRVRDLLKLAQQQAVQVTRVEAGRLDH